MDTTEAILRRQDGVIARREACAAGMDRATLVRLLRRGQWVSLHSGVYVTHNGPPTWRQRAWAAVLACWPAALDGRSAIRARDVAEGTCSVLEHGYLTQVERPHGLPRGERQAPAVASVRRMLRDVRYAGRRPPWAQIVELDGRLHHDSTAARDRDMERDCSSGVAGAVRSVPAPTAPLAPKWGIPDTHAVLNAPHSGARALNADAARPAGVRPTDARGADLWGYWRGLRRRPRPRRRADRPGAACRTCRRCACR